jgi:phosphohistidine phosphatase
VNLYLVQHAEAMSKAEDPDRPLSSEGLQNIRKTAYYASEKLKLRPSVIYHSGKTRAEQTAQILGKRLNPVEGVKQSDGLAPMDKPEIWVERLQNMTSDIMLVGHLPYMDRLTSLLICGDPAKEVIAFRNAAIVCLSGEKDSWSLTWILTPEMV